MGGYKFEGAGPEARGSWVLHFVCDFSQYNTVRLKTRRSGCRGPGFLGAGHIVLFIVNMAYWAIPTVTVPMLFTSM